MKIINKIWSIINKLFRNKEFYIPKIEFIREQDGVPERRLKSGVNELFKIKEEILRAYLVRVKYNNETKDINSLDVALCIKKIAGSDDRLAKKIGEIYASQFGVGKYLDIIFIDDEKENRIKKVAKPFYQRQ